MTEVREPEPAGPRPRGWWFDAVLLLGFVAITVALLASRDLLRLDVWVRDWSDHHRPTATGAISRVLNFLGNGSPLAVIALGIAVLLAWRLRTVRPVLPVVGAELLTLFTLGPVKVLTERGAPHFGKVALFSEPMQQSYPSGHLVNTIVWFGVIIGLVAPYWPGWLIWLIRLVPPIVVSVTTVYLGYHWFTDTAAGILFGLFLHRVMLRIPWHRIPLPASWDRGRAPGRSVPAG